MPNPMRISENRRTLSIIRNPTIWQSILGHPFFRRTPNPNLQVVFDTIGSFSISGFGVQDRVFDTGLVKIARNVFPKPETLSLCLREEGAGGPPKPENPTSLAALASWNDHVENMSLGFRVGHASELTT